MTDTTRCPECGAQLPNGAPAGLCPRCLLKAGLPSGVGIDPRLDPTEAQAAASSKFDPPTPAELAGRFPQFEILELLGRGGMGAVYKARQRSLDRLVAVKILPPEVGSDPAFAERFTREARALAQLSHPNIVAVHDFGQADGQYYLVMEYVDGVNLRQLLSTPLPSKETLAIVPQVCDALQFAHDSGVVHRDIKPENILIDKRGRVKIADFGLAKLLGQDHPADTLTAAHQVMGTLRYMAPEQMEGAADVDHRADIYSLGVVFYELLTGQIPMGRFDPPSKKVHVDVRLDEVVLRAMEREPGRRYQHASDVKSQLEVIAGLAPLALQRAFGREYRSKATVFGLPLLHIATGIDPTTGKRRIAKGIIAYGDIAFGLFSCGGLAVGGVAIGGTAVGLLSCGGCALGLLMAVGGLAIGGFAFGGAAIGTIALGGFGLGYYAFGGAAFGVHSMGGNGVDPEGQRFFEPWAYAWPQWLTILSLAMPAWYGILFLATWLFLRRTEKPGKVEGDSRTT